MKEHLSRELFRAISTGWRNPGDLAAIAIGHLFELCAHCRREYEAWRREVPDEGAVPEHADYESVIESIRARVQPASEGAEAPIDSDIRHARSRAEDLLRLPPEQQAEWIRTESERHAGPLLAEVLIEESRRKTPGYPRQGYTLADLARLVLYHAPASVWNAQLYARALARMSNAVRVIGDLPRAEQMLRDARYLLRSQGGGDRLVRTELDGLEGSLLNAQERRDDAVAILLRVYSTYRFLDDTVGAAATLIKLSTAHHCLGAADRALALANEADTLLAHEPDLWLLAMVRDHQARSLSCLGDVSGAWETLAVVRDLDELHDDPLLRLRHSWMEAEVAEAAGELERAHQTLSAVRDAFSAIGLRYDAALASVDLGGLCLDLGRFGEAEELAAEALPVFEELGLPAKVAAARHLRARAAGA